MNDALLRLALLVIAAITVASGFTQIVTPGAVLEVLDAQATAPSRHLFATVGMFMVVTGGMFFQTLWRRSSEAAVPFWIGVQKMAAAVFVGWGVGKGMFAPLALVVAGFDLLSGVLAWWYVARRGQ